MSEIIEIAPRASWLVEADRAGFVSRGRVVVMPIGADGEPDVSEARVCEPADFDDVADYYGFVERVQAADRAGREAIVVAQGI